MQFYDSTKATNAICQEIDRLCDSNDTSYPRLDKTARVNTALEQVTGWLINADGTWQFDDANFTTSPVGTGTLVSGQHKYTFSDKFLQIEEVDILDLNGYFRRIKPFDASEMGISWEEHFGITSSAGVDTAQSGFPQYYDKQSNVLKFDLAPTADYVTLTSGLRVRFKRTASLFTAVSTTAVDATVPGFDSSYHVILAYMAAIPYCMSYKKDRVTLYTQIVGDTEPASGMKKGLLASYGRKEKDVRKVATMAFKPFR